jgi:hypothetical protein
MATPSEVKAGLDDIAQDIRTQRAALTAAISQAAVVEAGLHNLAQRYAGVVETVNGYGVDNAFEAVSKAELAALTGEFVELLNRATAAASA